MRKHLRLRDRLRASDSERQRLDLEAQRLSILLVRASIVLDLALAAVPIVKRDQLLAVGARNFGEVDDVTFGIVADRLRAIVQS